PARHTERRRRQRHHDRRRPPGRGPGHVHVHRRARRRDQRRYHQRSQTPPPNVYIITDFNSPDDTIWLGSAIFTTLTPGNIIGADQFCIGDTALDGDDRIIYDQTNGEIMYAPGGPGAAAPILFAQVTPGLAIAYDDFLVSF